MAPSILVIHPGALGDVLLAVPALRWLKKQFPDHRLLLISNEPVGQLLLECRLIQASVPLQGAICASLWSSSIPDSAELRDWLKPCDLAVAWLKDEDRGLAATLEHFGVGEIRIQSPFSPQLGSRHQSDRFLESLGTAAVERSADEPLQLSTSVVAQGRACLLHMGLSPDRPFVMIHPGSGSRHKCTHPEVLASVMVALNQEGLGALVLEGPADEAVMVQLRQRLPMAPTVLRGHDLPIVAGVMAQARVYIGHDSGMTHLAALLGVPTLALFGPTDSNQWAPRGAHTVVLRGTPCGCHSWEEVCHCENKPCLAMSGGDILEAVRSIIGNGVKSTTPRNHSDYALFQQSPCATVIS